MSVNSYGQGTSSSSGGNGTLLFCPFCGAKLSKEACFCSNCGKNVEQVQVSSNRKQHHEEKIGDEPIRERQTVYEGEVHKCPNCGEVLKSFFVNCPTCGYEFRGSRNSFTVKEFATKLEEIEKTRQQGKGYSFMREGKGFSFKKLDEKPDEVSETDKKKISLIRSYAIPNTKEDLLEFLILASSNIDMQRYSGDSISKSQKAVSDAWEAKFEQAYEKAKLSFGNTPEFREIESIHEKKKAQIADSEKKHHTQQRNLFFIIAGSILIFFLFIFIMATTSIADDEINRENTRLETVVKEVYDALEKKDYVLARAKATSLVFSGPNTAKARRAAEKWDKTRTELLAIIDAAEKGDSVDIPETKGPSVSG